jgi:hypothetical protein
MLLPERAQHRRQEAPQVRRGAGDGDDAGPCRAQVGGGGIEAIDRG